MRKIAAEIKARLDQAVSLDDVGLTPRRMTDIFKQEYGVTPKEYADSLRLSAAKEMLSETQEKVWAALREIPYGETRSYKDIAEAIGHPKAFRAVGVANHVNPIFIAIPCHRVIGASGALVGYGGGLEMKKALLELERSNRE